LWAFSRRLTNFQNTRCPEQAGHYYLSSTLSLSASSRDFSHNPSSLVHHTYLFVTASHLHIMVWPGHTAHYSMARPHCTLWYGQATLHIMVWPGHTAHYDMAWPHCTLGYGPATLHIMVWPGHTAHHSHCLTCPPQYLVFPLAQSLGTTLMLEVVCSSKTVVLTYKSTMCHIPKEGINLFKRHYIP
jgi:hypothetical protein